MKALALSRIGVTALKIYTNHLLVFTAGAICGAVEAFIIFTALYGLAPPR